MSTQPHRARNVALAAIVALGLAACGSAGGDGSKPPDYAAALRGSPPKLAALHARANDLIPGGPAAFREGLARLRG
jgi:hypothetical protein